jgi:hypothetical protein
MSATVKSSALPIASAGAAPCNARGICLVSATPRSGLTPALWSPDPCKYLFSHPSFVLFTPGVADSMKSWASKCERVVSCDPVACTIASSRRSHNGLNAAIRGCNPKNPLRSIAPSALPGLAIAMFGRAR